MPTTYAIPNGRTVMDATTYTATGSGQIVNNTDNGTVGFKPDLVWTKIRSTTGDHFLADSVRGVTNLINSNTTGAEYSAPNYYTSFNSNGFTLGSSNYGSGTLVGWQWQAGQGTNTTNTSGSITSTVSVNATAGFSIATYTGTGANATVGHGLGVAPQMIIVKSRVSSSYTWVVYHASLGATKYLNLNITDAVYTATAVWNDTAPTSSVFTVGTSVGVNQSTGTYVAYCWAPVAGFSQFGSYTGNGSTDGPFVYLGFRPKYILIKRTDNVSDWWVLDSSRDTYNVVAQSMYANSSAAEFTETDLDFLSNGFKLRKTTSPNSSGGTFIYMAFCENPFKFANAR